jgi:hypothetical protein
MKRQLKNILDEYFKDSDFAAKWKALNNDDMSPNLNNITNVHDVLKQCSQILCRHRADVVQESPIDQLKELFRIDTEDVAEITTQDVPLSKKRKCSVPYNAFDGIKSIDQPSVEVADTGFTGEQFTRHQRDQIGEQDQPRHASMGGVMQAGSQWSVPGSSDTELTGATSNAPSALGHQTRSTNWVPDDTPNDPAGVQSGASMDFTDGTGFPRQTLQHGQDAYAFAIADPNADSFADVEIEALDDLYDDWYNSEYLPQNPIILPEAPNARQNTNSNSSNDLGTSDSWNTDFPPDMQYQQTVPQMPNAQMYPNVSANGIDNFNDWDLPHGQYRQTVPQISNTYVHSDASAGSGLEPLVNWNLNSMPQYSHMQQQQQRQNANTNTSNDLGTFKVMNPGSFPVHASATATNYEYPQYRNSAPYNYHAS